MRVLLSIVLMLASAGVGNAGPPSLSDHQAAPVKVLTSIGGSDKREGGEDFSDALLIGSLPFTDSGATCDNRDDITLPCAASAAPDVVYRYVAPASGGIDVTLCGSAYDTALGIYDESLVNLSCNDDYCGVQSEIDGIPVTAGRTYYIVVDGFSTNCGDYVISVTEDVPCVLSYPSDVIVEGEPDCYDGYLDTFDSGCNWGGWEPVGPTSGGHTDLWGKGGTFVYNGLSYRDTDWFEVTGTGANMTLTVEADFPVTLIFIYGTECANPLYDYAWTESTCEPISVTRWVAGDATVWPWVGASGFSGIPCGSNYVLSLDGIGGIGSPDPAGACCLPSGECQYISYYVCLAADGTYLGRGVNCEPGICTTGACCLPGGDCQLLAEPLCEQQSGVWMGAGVPCGPETCSATAVEHTTWGAIKSRLSK
jgi:hypothetical protein